MGLGRNARRGSVIVILSNGAENVHLPVFQQCKWHTLKDVALPQAAVIEILGATDQIQRLKLSARIPQDGGVGHARMEYGIQRPNGVGVQGLRRRALRFTVHRFNNCTKRVRH